MPYLFPGIRFDPREPPPPGFRNFHVAAHVQPCDDVGRGNPHGVPFAVQPPALNPWAHREDPAEDSWSEEDQPQPVPARRPVRRQAVHERPAVAHRREPQQDEAFLAPLSSSVNIQIVHDTAKFTVVHLFNNQTNFIKQGVYQFPLPHEATVTDFTCRIGQNRIVRGKVKEKEQARQEFNNAARMGRVGGLVEQETTEIFTTTLANIPPDTKLRAELTFMCLLKHRVSQNREVFTLTIPTHIAPRYGELPAGVRVDARNNHYFGLEVDVLTTEELLNINSDTHNITFNRGVGQRPCQTWNDFVVRRDEAAVNSKTASIQLEDGRASLDKDLVIDIITAMSNESGDPQACLETHPTYENHKALMLTVPPDFMLSAEGHSHDGEIIFVADRSGSMVDKIESLRSAMMFFINGIPANRPFNIWCFGSASTSMWPRSRPFNEATKREAIDYVRHEFVANMGGTDILPALQNIYNARGGYHSMDVIVLTDGELWSPNETIDFVKQRWSQSEGMIRFFSLGIGHAVSHELVEGIAKAGGGYAEVIADVNGGGWEDRVVAVLKAATTGHIGSIQIELEWKQNDGGNNPPVPAHKSSPCDISTLSPFIRNRVFWMFDSGDPSPELAAIVLKARGPNGQITKRVLPKILNLSDATIHKLAVRALLGDLERGESWLHQNRIYGENPHVVYNQVRQEAIKLGSKWSLVSQYTSLVAIEEETTEPNEGMDFDIGIPDANDGVEDALLRPRGGGNLNADRLLGPADPAEDDNSDSDSDDSVDTPSAAGDKTDDGSENEEAGNSPGNNAAGRDEKDEKENDLDEKRSRDQGDQEGDGQQKGDGKLGQRARSAAAPSKYQFEADDDEEDEDFELLSINEKSSMDYTRLKALYANVDADASTMYSDIDARLRAIGSKSAPLSMPSSSTMPQIKERQSYAYSNAPVAKSSAPMSSYANSSRSLQLSSLGFAGSPPEKKKKSGVWGSITGHTKSLFNTSKRASASSSGSSSIAMNADTGIGVATTFQATNSTGQSRPLQSADLRQPTLSAVPAPLPMALSLPMANSLHNCTMEGISQSSYYPYNYSQSSYYGAVPSPAPPGSAATGSTVQVPSLGPTSMFSSAQSPQSQYVPYTPVTSGASASASHGGAYIPAVTPQFQPLPQQQLQQQSSSQRVNKSSIPVPSSGYAVSSSPYNLPHSVVLPQESNDSVASSGSLRSSRPRWSSMRERFQRSSSQSSPAAAAPDASSNSSYQTSTPVYNPPASSSLLRRGLKEAKKTKTELEAEDFVRSLLAYQRSDGCFSLTTTLAIKSAIGPSFLKVVEALQDKYGSIDIVVTSAIVALLEVQFQSCQPLWVLMVRKARDYVSSRVSESDSNAIMLEANNRVACIGPVMKDVENAKNARVATVELECAPIH
ncbi:von Willebrand factor A domain-containing protein [Cladobotryum mycophilum]|uniref:von Willebrand factor A domain-containing protein n=1 Tax=Cladobotryum mycophilum TaxID=491253 RepID=A0ABR0SLG6_9HYPO